jgi:hypothetical protein
MALWEDEMMNEVQKRRRRSKRRVEIGAKGNERVVQDKEETKKGQ